MFWLAAWMSMTQHPGRVTGFLPSSSRFLAGQKERRLQAWRPTTGSRPSVGTGCSRGSSWLRPDRHCRGATRSLPFPTTGSSIYTSTNVRMHDPAAYFYVLTFPLNCYG